MLSVPCQLCRAVPIDTLFAKMPPALLPLLDWDGRLDCLDLYNGKMRAEVTNVLGERSRLVEKTDDYLRVELSAASRMELKLLPLGGDTVVWRIHTVLAPAAESRLDAYTTRWEQAEGVAVPVPAVSDFWVRPDTLTEERFDELRHAAGVPWVAASFSPTAAELTFSLSLDDVRSDWRDEMSRCLRPLTYRWDGTGFTLLPDRP